MLMWLYSNAKELVNQDMVDLTRQYIFEKPYDAADGTNGFDEHLKADVDAVSYRHITMTD